MSDLRLPPGKTGQGPQERAADLLQRLTTNPNDQEAERLFAEIFEDVEGDNDFRLGAPGTLERQNAHLKLWVHVMRLNYYKVPGFVQLTEKQVIDRTIKNSTSEEVLLNLQIFLRGTVALTNSQDLLEKRPTYSTLVQYRNSAIFWIQREMKRNAPRKDDMLNAANQTLQRSARKWGVNKTRKVKTFFGRYELLQLMDWDMARSPYMPVAESHHLAWCLGLICGVRPGSIGHIQGYENQFLCFREVEITRGSARGIFNSKIQFLHLKGNRESLIPEEGLTFSVNGSVLSETLPASVPHRLLVMLLRRGGLEAHDSLESLLNGKEHFIAIKEKLLDEPVCRMGGPRGLSIRDEAISAAGLTNYLSEQAMHAGYPRGITMYCWRRKAGTTWTRSVGPDRARQMMGHKLGTTTLEDHYDQGFYDIPVFEEAMRQDTTLAHATMDEDSSEVLMRMVDHRRLQGAFLNRQINQILEDNQEYQTATENNDARAMINLENRARDLANKVFHDERKKVHDKNLTQEEFERRKAALKQPGELVKRVRNAVRNRMKRKGISATGSTTSVHTSGAGTQRSTDAHPGIAPQGSEQRRGRSAAQIEHDRQLAELDQDGDLDANDLIDIDDDYNAEGQEMLLNVTADRTVSWDEGSAETPEEFAAAVEIFMTELGKDKFHTPDELICELCQNSPWRSDEDKNKVWPGASKLRSHQLGKTHSKHGEIYLKLQYLKDASGSDKYSCPYGRCEGTYFAHEALVRHIRSSRAPEPDDNLDADTRAALQLHDDEKRADGWYDDDFDWSAEKNKPDVLNANRRRNLGLQYTDEKELSEPFEVVIQPSYKVVVGGGGQGALMTEIPAHYQDILAFGDDDNEPYQHVVPLSTTGLAVGHDPEDASEHVHPLREVPDHLQATLSLGEQGRRYEHPMSSKRSATGK